MVEGAACPRCLRDRSAFCLFYFDSNPLTTKDALSLSLSLAVSPSVLFFFRRRVHEPVSLHQVDKALGSHVAIINICISIYPTIPVPIILASDLLFEYSRPVMSSVVVANQCMVAFSIRAACFLAFAGTRAGELRRAGRKWTCVQVLDQRSIRVNHVPTRQ